jgi:glucosamine-6-phosphate deaminase
MNIVKTADYEELSTWVSNRICEKINWSNKFVIGLATGSTPIRLYQLLRKQYDDGQVNFQHVYTFNLDEYVGLEKANKNSYHHYMETNLFQFVNIPRSQTHIPNGMADDLTLECENYEKKIKQAGGIDLQILGLGLNGHIGFNEPGSSFDSLTHIVNLDEVTRAANARFFSSIEEVPKQAITMGLLTIMNAKEIILMVSGKRKAKALQQLLNGEVTESFPASILKKHPNVTIVADFESLNGEV